MVENKTLEQLENELVKLKEELKEVEEYYYSDPALDQEAGFFVELAENEIAEKEFEIADHKFGQEMDNFRKWYYGMPRSERPY